MAALGNQNNSKTGSAVITIAASATTSEIIDCRGRQAVAFILPAMTGTSVAVHASDDGVTFYAASYNSVAVTMTASASASWQALPSNMLAGANYIRLVSSASEAALRSITVVGLQLVG